MSKPSLPSNKKFGFFFAILFLLTAAYFLYQDSKIWACFFCFLSASFLIITLFKSDILLPLNKLWMRFGLLLGMIVSPVVMGVIFFGVFTPIAFFMRLFGRDELHLRFKKKNSHWIRRETESQSDSFKFQF